MARSDATRSTAPGVREAVRAAVRRIGGTVVPPTVDYAADAFEGRLLDRDDVERLAERVGDVYRFGAPERHRIDPPGPPGDQPPELCERAGTYRLQRPFVCELPDCRLVGPYPVALTRDNRIVVDAVVRPTMVPVNVRASIGRLRHDGGPRALARGAVDAGRGLAGRTPADATGHRHFETATLLFNGWSDGYFHWLFECLTRLEGVVRYARATGEWPTILVDRDLADWQREGLALLGLDEHVEAWDATVATVDRLVVPTVRRDGVVSADAARWLAARLQRGVDDADEGDDAAGATDGTAFASRVYVSRDDADRRRVVNEPALVDALASLGFERYVPGELSVPDQIRLFAGADAVVAPHGAGLANVIHGEDLTVVELLKGDDVRAQYCKLAGILGFDYACLRCPPAGPDLRVDVERARAVVAAALED
jgi:hypothetical protein